VTFTIFEGEQRSPEWFAARVGRLTGSNADILYKQGKKKGEESVMRRDLRIRLAVERITGEPQDEDFNKPSWMQRGIDAEHPAVGAYEAKSGNVVRLTGFLSGVEHMVGCSLDGHVGDFARILEIKCPKTFTHIGYLRSNCVPSEYLPQVLHNLWVSGADACDFVSFDDRLKGGDLLILTVEAGSSAIAAALQDYKERALAFLEEVKQEEKEIRELLASRAAA
jgi:hypothetical protein